MYLNDYDKEYLISKFYNGEINFLSLDEKNEMVREYLDEVDWQFISDNELFFIIFQAKPFYENGFIIGELSSTLDFDKKTELLEYLNRPLH